MEKSNDSTRVLYMIIAFMQAALLLVGGWLLNSIDNKVEGGSKERLELIQRITKVETWQVTLDKNQIEMKDDIKDIKKALKVP